MPASTSDPISSVLQRTFGGMDGNRLGLIRGGNSASARSSVASLDVNLQATAKRSLLINGGNSGSGGIKFDNPTCYTSSSGLRQSNGVKPKQHIIILNPQNVQKKENGTNGKSTADNRGGEQSTTAPAIPKAKIVFFPPCKIDVGYQEVRSAGAGMANVGNTCYLNSTLQALFHTPALFNFLLYDCGSQHMSKCSSSSIVNGFMQSCTICALALTLKDTLRSNVIRPNRVYEKLKTICKHMVHGRQEDAHEFLRYLIDSLQRSYLTSMHASKNLDSASKETTPFNQIFGGYMRQDVTCMRCKYVSTTFQHFMDILVDIRQVSTIEEALAQFFRQEKLGNSGDEASMYKCERCKVKVPAKRRCLIEKAPAVLCIQLKRFSLLGGKISKPVQLSRHLNIAPFIYPRDGGADNLPSVQYKLVSMITHVGPSPNCGHYTAIGEAGNGQFFQFDDASVRAIPLGQVLNTASYVVFYEMTRSSWAACIGTNTQQQKSAAVHPNSLLKESRPSSLSGSRNSLSSNGSGPSQGFRPKIISANGLSNKLGVVSAAAKHVAGAVADAARSVTNNIVKTNNGQASKAMGLVPYDDESSDEDTTAKASHSLPPQPAFVPRSVTVKTLSLKSQQSSCIGQKTVSATSGNWTVTDLDHHNPSVHSDNSTGSTNGGWVITSQNTSRPSSAMSEDTASNLSSKWTVTPLKRAIDETLPSKSQANGTSPSTPTSSASSSTSGTNTSSSLSSNNEKKRKAEEDHERITRKRPSVDDQDGRDQTAPLDHYNAELDRGRTKKVKRQEISYNSSNGGGDGRSNPFQSQQNRHNQQKHHGRSSSASSSSSSGGRQHGHWDQDRNRSRDHHRDHNYHSSNHYYGKDKYYQRRRSYGGGESSSSGGGGGGGDHRDKHHNSSSNRSFNRSFSSSNDGHRDSYRHWSSR